MALSKILVVDDEESMCQFLSIMLRKDGHEVQTASSGEKALQMIVDEPFDAVITDIRMSGKNGLDVLSGVKETDPTLPVVILTAYASQETAIEAVNLGAYSYIEKPYDVDQLLLTLRRAIEKQPRVGLFLGGRGSGCVPGKAPTVNHALGDAENARLTRLVEIQATGVVASFHPYRINLGRQKGLLLVIREP